MLNNQQNIFYVYKHTFINGSVYIGKGKGNRAYSFKKRGRLYNFTFNKHGEPSVKIIEDKLSEEDSFLLEMKHIYILKQSGIKLCNLTDGGEGISGYKFSDEARQKRKDAIEKNGGGFNKGIKMSDKAKRKMSLARKGIYIGLLCPSTGVTRSEETRNKISKSRKGICTGEEHHMFGKSHLVESIEKMKKTKRESSFQPKGMKRTNSTKINMMLSATNRNIFGQSGITFDKQRNKFVAKIGKKFLGRFDNLEDAIQCRKYAENCEINLLSTTESHPNSY